jgi:DNA mismatch repair ATPase MutS
VHLVEQTANGKMTFDHKLREGFLTSGNALRLMRDMGLPVPAEAPATNDE